MNERGSSWRVAAASALGTSHAKLGTPCQDAHVVKTFSDKDGHDVLVVVVSDGAGSAAKAEVGSLLTCKTVIEAIESYIVEGRTVEDISVRAAESWVKLVQDAIQIHAADDGRTKRDYACTMLVAVVGHDTAAVMQIGDGATVVGDDDGWCWVHWPQHGEFANTTNFVTDEGAGQKLAFDLCRQRIEEVAVFSDGIERLVLHEASKTVFAPFFDRMFPPVRRLLTAGVDVNLSGQLHDYLSSKTINDRTDDDKTLVIASRLDPSARGSVTSPTEAAPEGA